MPDDVLQNKENQGDQFSPYPPNRIVIHTMDSDIEEFKKSGGQIDFSGYDGAPSGQAQPPSAQKVSGAEASLSEPAGGNKISAVREEPLSPPLPPAEKPSINPVFKEGQIFSSEPRQAGEPAIPMKDVFESSIAPEKESATATEPSLPAVQTEKKNPWTIIAAIGGILILLAAGFSVYWFFIKESEPQPPVATSTPVPTETPVLTPEITPVPTILPTPQPYISLFQKPADKTAEITLSEKSQTLLLAGIIKEAQIVELENTFKEIIFRESDGISILSFKDFIGLMIPQVATVAASLGTDLNDLFESNFSFFLLYDPKATQMSYAVKMKPDKYLAAANLLSLVEKENNLVLSLKNHFLINAGEKISDFKSGKISQIETRYMPFQNAGLAFDYGFWKEKDLFVVATSKEAINKIILGLTDSSGILGATSTATSSQ